MVRAKRALMLSSIYLKYYMYITRITRVDMYLPVHLLLYSTLYISANKEIFIFQNQFYVFECDEESFENKSIKCLSRTFS